jgi:hypothetical protein
MEAAQLILPEICGNFIMISDQFVVGDQVLEKPEAVVYPGRESKLLRTQRYGFRWKSWKLSLGSEQAILSNNIELLLSTNNSEESIVKFFRNLQEQQYLNNRLIFKQLYKLLGQNYNVYIKNMTELSTLLQQLQQKLELVLHSAQRVSHAPLPQIQPRRLPIACLVLNDLHSGYLSVQW